MSIESPGALMYPPELVKVAARHAFREHSRTAGRPVPIVFDSNRDEVTRDFIAWLEGIEPVQINALKRQ